MAHWYIVGGTVGFDQDFVIEMPEGTVKNLNGWTLTLYVWKAGGSSELFTGTVHITESADGTCYYTLAEGDADTDDKGEYLFSIKMTDGTDTLYTVAKTVEILEGPPI